LKLLLDNENVGASNTTRRHNPEDVDLNLHHRRESLKSRIGQNNYFAVSWLHECRTQIQPHTPHKAVLHLPQRVALAKSIYKHVVGVLTSGIYMHRQGKVDSAHAEHRFMPDTVMATYTQLQGRFYPLLKQELN